MRSQGGATSILVSGKDYFEQNLPIRPVVAGHLP